MDKEDLLDFNYPLQSAALINLENKIKQSLRDNALNMNEEVDIEKYSDRYVTNTSYKSVVQAFEIELLGPELQGMFGFESRNTVPVIPNEIDEEGNNSSEHNEEDEAESLGGGDDYENNYYDDEELVNDVQEKFEDYF